MDHRHKVAVAVLLCVLPGFVSPSAAQSTTQVVESTAPPLPPQSPPVAEPPVIILSAQRIEEAERWAREFDAWQQWAARWLNQRQPGFWSSALERNKKPDPPGWLEDMCGLVVDDQLARPCKLFDEWRDDLTTAKIRQASAAAVIQREAPTKSAWWRHAHLDTMWSTAQSDTRAFGLFGAHLTMEVKGRLQVFVAPGIMLVSVPQAPGTRELIPATDWGVTYRLFDLGPSTVHFNLVHAWVLTNGTNLLRSQLSLAGFSFSFRQQQAP